MISGYNVNFTERLHKQKAGFFFCSNLHVDYIGHSCKYMGYILIHDITIVMNKLIESI